MTISLMKLSLSRYSMWYIIWYLGVFRVQACSVTVCHFILGIMATHRNPMRCFICFIVFVRMRFAVC